MNYGCYKNARNASWHCLIDYKINSLPVKVSRIAKQADITLLKNSAVNLLNNSESGTTLMQNDKLYIIYADEQSAQRCRFTIAHELGHIFLGHLFNKDGDGFATTDDPNTRQMYLLVICFHRRVCCTNYRFYPLRKYLGYVI